MRISSLSRCALMTGALLSSSAAVFAQEPEQVSAPEQRLLTTLRQLYPATTFTRVQRTPIASLYEVTLGNRVAYAAEDGRYFVFGHLFDLQTQRDLTPTSATNTAVPQRVDFAALPLADAIKTVRGDGTRTLAVFSDPDCPYCQSLDRQLTTLENVTVYTFLLPLASLHPQARQKAISVWCARDRARAWSALMLQQKSPPSRTCAHPIERNLALAEKLAIRGTPTLIAGDGRVAVGAMAAAQLAAWLDAGAGVESTAAAAERRP